VGDLSDVPLQSAAADCFPTQPDVDETIDDVLIFIEFVDIDGVGKTLGQAGPCYIRKAAGRGFDSLGGSRPTLSAGGRSRAKLRCPQSDEYRPTWPPGKSAARRTAHRGRTRQQRNIPAPERGPRGLPEEKLLPGN
jgi:hypothetical protein